MAKCEMKLPDDILLSLSKLGDKLDTAAPRRWKRAKVVLRQMQQNLRAVVEKIPNIRHAPKVIWNKALALRLLYKTRMVTGISVSGGRFQGFYGCAKCPQSTGSGIRKSGQLPRPWMKPAKRKAKREMEQAMKAVLESEVKP